MQNSKQSAVLPAGHAESSSSGTVPCKAGRFKKPAALLGPYPRCKRQEEPLQTDLSTLDAIQEMVANKEVLGNLIDPLIGNSRAFLEKNC